MLLSIPLQIMKMQNNLLHTYRYGNKNTNTNSLDTVKVDFEKNVKTSTNDKEKILILNILIPIAFIEMCCFVILLVS